ncbi:hypothetical protein BYT27DRAFT_7247311 [Phlegmacium glaucopus]|nr:hypothetical protein BYT27DRAFT_7247311 [Phlegmacium glaucopus]
MSTQSISDYLTKQIFIDRNIVTYRSLSRHFAIHVNIAKKRLATYHHDAPYKSQTCAATYLLSGTVLRKYQYKDISDDDVDMDEGPASTQQDDDGGGDNVPQVQITIVNETELKAAKASYDKIHSIHVYSLSPSPIHDAGLVCAPTEYVRNTDKNAAIDFAGKVGRVVGADIKMRNLKKGKQPAVPVAGPSRLKQHPVPETKPSVRESAPVIDNPKPKASGKIEFFKAKPKEIKEIKKEEPAREAKKKMFFTKAPSPTPSVANEEVELEPPTRGIKRKSSVGLEPRTRTPENPAVTNNVRVKGRVVLSDDELETPAPVPKRTLRQKSRVISRVESPEREIDQAALALMDIDDDQVEKVVHELSTNVSTTNEDENEQLDDVEMADGTTSEPKKTRKKREKKTIPVGSNGLKKKKVTKTRKMIDKNGYMRTEDYSDWESVDEEAEPEPPSRPKGKRKAVSVKKEDEDTDVPPVLTDSKDNLIEAQQVPQNTPAPAAKKKQSKTSGAKAKPQKGLLNFFGPKKS